MAEMDAQFQEMIDTLSKGRLAVSEELEMRVETESRDVAALEHLRGSVRALRKEAESLILIMQEREPTTPLLRTARELNGFFEAAESEVESLLAAARA